MTLDEMILALAEITEHCHLTAERAVCQQQINKAEFETLYLIVKESSNTLRSLL